MMEKERHDQEWQERLKWNRSSVRRSNWLRSPRSLPTLAFEVAFSQNLDLTVDNPRSLNLYQVGVYTCYLG